MLPTQDSECRGTLIKWFKTYPTERHEIEYRIQDVGLDEFESLVGAVSKGHTETPWKSPQPELLGLVRETQHAADGCETMRLDGNTISSQVERRTHEAGLEARHHHHTAYVAACLLMVDSADSSETSNVTYRQYHTFHRESGGARMTLELARVKSGPTDEQARQADTRYQVSIKVQCGSKAKPEYLVDSMLMKADDIIKMIVPRVSDGPSPSKRSRSLPSLPALPDQVPARNFTV